MSNATDTEIFTNSHNMKLTALAPGFMLDSRLVMPRAIRAAGTTTTAAPQSADRAVEPSPVTSHTSADATAPTPACTPDDLPRRDGRRTRNQGLRLLGESAP
jgi:hypothetical protein